MIDSNYFELVEWCCKLMTQYTIRELWEMNFVQFHRLVGRAEEIQKKRLAQLQKAKR